MALSHVAEGHHPLNSRGERIEQARKEWRPDWSVPVLAEGGTPDRSYF